MQKIEYWAARVWRAAISALLFAVVLITLSQVFARYVFNSSIVWSEELNRLLFVWVIMLGAAGGAHMRIGLLADKPHLRQTFSILSAIGITVGLALIVWGGWKLQTMFAFDRYTTLDLSKAWYFAAAIVGGCLWAGAALWRAFRLQSERSDGPTQETSP